MFKSCLLNFIVEICYFSPFPSFSSIASFWFAVSTCLSISPFHSPHFLISLLFSNTFWTSTLNSHLTSVWIIIILFEGHYRTPHSHIRTTNIHATRNHSRLIIYNLHYIQKKRFLFHPIKDDPRQKLFSTPPLFDINFILPIIEQCFHWLIYNKYSSRLFVMIFLPFPVSPSHELAD